MANASPLPVRGVSFDLVGTLMHGRRPIGEEYARQLALVGVVVEPLRLEAAFGASMAAAPPMASSGRSFAEAGGLERTWWRSLVRQVLAHAGLDGEPAGERFEVFFESLYSHFTTGDAWELYGDVTATLGALKARGVALGLVTNYDMRVFPVLRALGLSSLIDSVTIPAHVGAAKPDPAIFRYAVEHLGLAPAEVLHVGDEVEDDYLGAEAAGLRAVLIDRGAFARAAGVRRIESLSELLTQPGLSVGTR